MTISELITKIDGYIWGPPLMILLVGTGLYLTFRLFFIQFRGFKESLLIIAGKYDRDDDPGEISHFQALSAALSATVGTGNIVGVAAAILVGGPGAVFWMWVTAFVGMATKFTSCTLAVHFRRIDESGEAHGGPMHFILMGLGKNFKWLAILFALFTAIASFGIGNMFQINNIVVNLNAVTGFMSGEITLAARLAVGIIFAAIVGVIILGGIKSIGRFTSKLTPFMCLFYLLAGLTILALNLDQVPAAFKSIFYFAFNKPEALAGGLLGSVIRAGVSRGLFSNEAGMGSAAMIHGAARTREPVREGLVAMIGPFIDTILICSITALVIIVTGAAAIPGIEKGVLTSQAFSQGLGSAWGAKLVSMGIVLFAFSTLISWSYYGDRAVDFLFGKRYVPVYRIIYMGFIVLGACLSFETVINLCDAFNGLMIVPNLVALIILSPLVAGLTKKYIAEIKKAD